MSRYHIRCSNNLEAIAGYDRPLNHFFITIYDPAIKDENDIVYSNLNEESNDIAFPKNLNVIKEVAQSFGLKIPSQMWNEIQTDFDNQVGNKEVRYDENGTRTQYSMGKFA